MNPLDTFAEIKSTCELAFKHDSAGKTSTASTFRLLHALIRYNRPKNVVEIGCGEGWSTAWMLQALHENGSGHIEAFEPDPSSAENAVGLLSSMGSKLNATWNIRRIAIEEEIGRILADFVFLDLEPKENYTKAMANIEIERDGLLVAHDWKIASPVRDFADDLAGKQWDVTTLAGERGMVIARRR